MISIGIPIAPNAAGYFDDTRRRRDCRCLVGHGRRLRCPSGSGDGQLPGGWIPRFGMFQHHEPQSGIAVHAGPERDVHERDCGPGVPYPTDAGALAYSSIWGNVIGFDFNDPEPPAGDAGLDGGDSGVARAEAGAGGWTLRNAAGRTNERPPGSRREPPMKGQYNAPAHGVTGVAFDIDNPPGPNFRVEFQTLGTENNAAYWNGAVSQSSPATVSGH